VAKPLHNRMVGTVVLLALGVLFLPDLLNGEKTRVEEQFATIPLRPEVQEATLSEEAFTPVETQSAPAVAPLQEDDVTDGVEVVAVDITPKPQPEQTQAAPVETAMPTQSGWSIRLGSFRNAANVNRLVKELRAQDYPAYTVPAVPKEGELTVVFVGPEIDQDRIKALQKELAEQHSLQTQLVRYDPLKI